MPYVRKKDMQKEKEKKSKDLILTITASVASIKINHPEANEDHLLALLRLFVMVTDLMADEDFDKAVKFYKSKLDGIELIEKVKHKHELIQHAARGGTDSRDRAQAAQNQRRALVHDG